MVCRSFFVMSSPHSAKWHVSLTITSCDIVTAHLVRGRVVAMVVMGMEMMGMEMMVEMVVAVMMIARLVMLNVVKHLYQETSRPLVPTNSESDSQHQYKTPSAIILL